LLPERSVRKRVDTTTVSSILHGIAAETDLRSRRASAPSSETDPIDVIDEEDGAVASSSAAHRKSHYFSETSPKASKKRRDRPSESPVPMLSDLESHGYRGAATIGEDSNDPIEVDSHEQLPSISEARMLPIKERKKQLAEHGVDIGDDTQSASDCPKFLDLNKVPPPPIAKSAGKAKAMRPKTKQVVQEVMLLIML
jgi:hypothetical protein